MKIQKFGSLKGNVMLGRIKHVTPFSFPGEIKVYIKIYPCTSYPGISDFSSLPCNLCMIIDLEQGGIITKDCDSLVTLLDYDFKVSGGEERE